ncbi:hypothetical protein BGZ54_005263, partial [Gamsiella multidivaricata]
REEGKEALVTIRASYVDWHKDFNPKVSYSGKGYALRGSIKTDGFRIQLLAFKLNELNCMKYRRLDADKLPDRLTSTLGGTGQYLTEIRNVVKTKEDVERLWGCDPLDIKILGIDLGKAFVEQGGIAEIEIPPMKFHNLAASQKAVYQPAFKHRRWLEQRKERSAEGQESIAQMETNLQALRVKVKESDLKTFYDNLVLKEHLWDDKRARDREFKLAAERLLKMIGGTPGKKRDNDNKVVISIRLGEFSSTPRLSSLHTAFSAYFVQL